MRALLAAPLLLAAVLLQVTWAPRLAVVGAGPNLALLAVVALTWLHGPRAVLPWAGAAGFLLDLSWPGPLGLHAIALLAACYAAGLVAERLSEGRVLLPAAAAALSSLVYGLIVIGGAETLGQPLPAGTVARLLLLGGALYDAVLIPLVLLLVARLDRLAPPPRPEAW
jgi:rod shape-determining protein MreD